MSATQDPLPDLLGALSSKHQDARLDAVRAIGRLGPLARDAVGSLAQLLDDGDGVVREAAAQALGQMGAAGVSALTHALSHEDKYVRRQAVWGLSKQGSRARVAIPDLCGALEDPDARTCTGAVQALGGMGPDAELGIPALLACMAGQNRVLCRMAAKALSQIGRAALGPLVESLSHPDPFVRGEAALALGWMGPAAAPAVPGLIDVLLAGSTSDPSMHLTPVGHETPRGSVTPAPDEMNESHRVYAAQALGRLGSAAALPALNDILQDRNEHIRAAARQAIRQIRAAG